MLALGKKGTGKTALIRKLAARAREASAPIFYLDPQAQIAPPGGRIYKSVDEWIDDPNPSFLSVFRECEVEPVAALALKLRGVTLVVDELDQAFNNKQWTSPSVKKIVHYGRHFRVCLLGTFRRTQNVSEDLLSQVDYVFLFRTTQACPFDLATISKRFGDDYAAEVTRLEEKEFVIWNDD